MHGTVRPVPHTVVPTPHSLITQQRQGGLFLRQQLSAATTLHRLLFVQCTRNACMTVHVTRP